MISRMSWWFGSNSLIYLCSSRSVYGSHYVLFESDDDYGDEGVSDAFMVCKEAMQYIRQCWFNERNPSNLFRNN